MILIGQYDSPFVRRVAITLHHYGIGFTRDKTSAFAPEMRLANPLSRIPSLVLDDGESIYDSVAILDHLDERVGPSVALMPPSGEERRRVLRATVVAAGAVEKTGAVVYERHMHAPAAVAEEWVARCLVQVGGALRWLDDAASSPWFFGARMTQADVTIGCLVGYLRMRLPEALAPGTYPALEALAARCDELEAFRQTRPSPDEVMPQKAPPSR